MKIVVATGTFPPEVSGQATFVSNFVRQISQHPGIQIMVVTYSNRQDGGTQVGNVFRVYRNRWRYLKYYQFVKRHGRQASIVYAHDLVSSGLPAALAKKRAGYKLVIRLGGDFLWERMVNAGACQVPLSRYYQQKKNWREKLYLLIYRYVLSRADMIIFNTEWQKDIYRTVFSLADNTLAVIGNPLVAVDARVRDTIAVGDEILFAGRLIPLKNVLRLIEAFRSIETDKKLVIIGDGPQKDQLKAAAQGDQRIEFRDSLAHGELLKQIAQAYLVVVPSLSELSPNVALEALALKKPVLLTKYCGLAADVKRYCTLIDPFSVQSIKEGIEYFLNQDYYSQAVVRSLPSYGWAAVVEEHLALFTLLVQAYEHR